jgi:hypothetical protein
MNNGVARTGMNLSYRAAARLAVPGLVLLLAAACATTLRGRYDFDERADFSRYRSYYWMNDDPVLRPDGHTPEISAMNLRRIVEAIEAELAAKGFAKAETREAADFVVAFNVGTRDRIEFVSYPWPYRYPWDWYPYAWDYPMSARTYTEGTLGIDVFDQQTHAPVWHGWLRKRVFRSDVDNPAPVIREAVAAVLAGFPPLRTGAPE